RWIELLSDDECEIRYHPGKENVMADSLSRKERSRQGEWKRISKKRKKIEAKMTKPSTE
nr:putative reverse transcriptase domain-containing protein [Tanacetum cinerariifolium]